MKRLFAAVLVLMLALTAFTACNSNDKGNDAADENPMQYITKEDLKDDLSSYVILDVRKAADFEAAHIVGAYSADVDAAREGDDESGIANLSAALTEATGSATGSGNTLVLVCYSGKAYAQKATDLLIGMGVSADTIYTLEGGNNGWADGGDDYTDLMQ